ncbi:MAG: hypothetical protein M3O31_16855 [Acidobacteriota bacterium]|nr:hypothetical protein [Acidobacteriota bacterium]
MKNNGWFAMHSKEQPSSARVRRAAGFMVVAMMIATAGAVVAQDTNGTTPAPESKFSTPDGYTAHHMFDAGGRAATVSGSGAMYDTLVNLHSGPRVFGESYSMHALPGKKHTLVDDLSTFGNGFGGDPYVVQKLDASKGKVYEFSGFFRRDRLYSDYNLLGNPNIPGGLNTAIGPSNAPVGLLAQPRVNQSPVMFNIVRRMTDTNLTLAPLSTFSVRFGYSHYTMEGPALSPSYTILKYNALLEQYQRNGSDDYLGAIDWKAAARTKITFEMQANHYKNDTFFKLNPNGFMAQEADGTPVYLGNFTAFAPYGITACNTASMGTAYTSNAVNTILSPATTPGGLPIINPACSVVTSYVRSLPTRTWTPTETIRFQSADIKNVVMNGNVHYTRGRSDMNHYYESAQGLSTTTAGQTGANAIYNGTTNRSVIWNGGNSTVQHTVIGADFGVVYHVAPTVSIADQATYSSTHEPGASIIPPQTVLATPAGAGNATINYSGALTTGFASLPHGVNGVLTYNYYGQEYLINNLTASWDPVARAQFSLTYRYSNRNIGQGVPHQGPIPDTSLADPVNGTVTINENAGVFTAALHPAKHWDLNGSAEIGYADNAFTAVGQRQFRTFRMHTLYRPTGWATFTGSISDRERHNNTNNKPASITTGDFNYSGPIAHEDRNRIGSVGMVLAPNEHYSLDFNYSYSDVYASTNTCYNNGGTAASTTTTAPFIPGAATLNSSGLPNLCAPAVGTTALTTWFGRDFMDAPTQFVSVGGSYTPISQVRLGGGYTISAVNGSRFFNDARDVNGSMVSAYQTPFLNFAYTMHPGLVWRMDYNYYGYGEGGVSGATLCSATPTSATVTVAPCSNYPGLTAVTASPAGFTSPRNFHANNVTLGLHYEF